MDSNGSCCSRADYAYLSTTPCCRREDVWTRTDAADRARLDSDYAFKFLSTAPDRRREVVRTRTEAAASARLDADYTYFSTASDWRLEVSGTGTWTCTRSRSSAGQYGEFPRTRPPAPPSPASPSFI